MRLTNVFKAKEDEIIFTLNKPEFWLPVKNALSEETLTIQSACPRPCYQDFNYSGACNPPDCYTNETDCICADGRCESGLWCPAIGGIATPSGQCTIGCKHQYNQLEPNGFAINWSTGDCSQTSESFMGEVIQQAGQWGKRYGGQCDGCINNPQSQTAASCCESKGSDAVQQPCLDAEGNEISYEWKQNTGENCPCGIALYQCWCPGTIVPRYECDISGDEAKCVEKINGFYSDLELCTDAIADGTCSVKYSCKMVDGTATCVEDPDGNFNGKAACENAGCETRYDCLNPGEQVNSNSPWKCEKVARVPGQSGYASTYETETECCDNCCGACPSAQGICRWFSSGILFNVPNCAIMTRDRCLSMYSAVHGEWNDGHSTWSCCGGSSQITCECDGYQDCPASCPAGQTPVISGTTGNTTCSCQKLCDPCPYWQYHNDDPPNCACVSCPGCPPGTSKVPYGVSGAQACECV